MNYQDSLYMGRDGVHHDVTEHPTLVDDLGVVRPSIETELNDTFWREPSMLGTFALAHFLHS